MRISTAPAAVLPQTIRRHQHAGHDVHDGIQAGHDVGAIGDAAAKAGEHAAKGRWLSELTREEMVEVRGMVAREGRQAALWGENAELTPHTALRGGAALLNGAVAIGAAYHGVELLKSPDPVTKIEGVNHLLMGAGCGLVAAHLAGGNPELGHLGGKFLIAHGVGEVGVGTYRAIRGEGRERTLGILQAAHGASLIGAELMPGLALPLCLTMAGLTGLQIALHRKPEGVPSH